MNANRQPVRLKLLPLNAYAAANRDDPIRFYRLPFIGALYRRRLELALNECRGGERVLEIGYGSGVSFLNLSEMYGEIHGLDLSANAAGVGAVFARHGIHTALRQGSLLTMPYAESSFDTVLAVSVLEHLQPQEQQTAFQEIRRVLKPGGQVVYGVPIDRPLMTFLFRLLGYDIRRHHFSTEKDIAAAARRSMREVRVLRMPGIPAQVGAVYEVGHFICMK